MAYFPASCDYDCKECSQNKCGWCTFHDCPTIGTLEIDTNQAVTVNSNSATIIGNKEESK